MKRLIACDLDGTLAVTKSPVSDTMARLLRALLDRFDVCVISGGKYEQFEVQVIERLGASPAQLARLHIMPTSGTRYLRYETTTSSWRTVYAEDLAADQRRQIADVLTEGAKALGLWCEHPWGDIIEDRGSQVTYSALGQEAPPDQKYAWDPDGSKKERLRAYAAERLPDLEVHAGGTTSVDVTRHGIDKAYGMRKLMEATGLAAGEILFFGDQLGPGGNDSPVLTVDIPCIAVRDQDECATAFEAIVAVTPGTTIVRRCASESSVPSR